MYAGAFIHGQSQTVERSWFVRPAVLDRPILIYDGACRFCRYWIRRWHRSTGERVLYRPFQSVAARFPQLARQSFEEAVQLVLPSGRVESGADAVFLTLEKASPHHRRFRSLRRMPGFMQMARWAYRFISRHRALFWSFYHVCRKVRERVFFVVNAARRI